MKFYLLWIFVCIHANSSLCANNYLRLADIRSIALGGNGVTQTVIFNPSLVSLLNGKNIRINSFCLYGIKELNHLSADFSYFNETLPFNGYISSFGYDEYRENTFRLSVAKNLLQRWYLGISIQYCFLQTELLTDRLSYLSTDLGITFLPVDKLLIGLVFMNVPSFYVRNDLSDLEYFSNYSVQIGFQWIFINNVLIMSSLEKNKNSFLYHVGLEYIIDDKFFVRSGFQTKPLCPSMGVGYSIYSFVFDVVAVYHPVLGISSGIGLSFSF